MVEQEEIVESTVQLENDQPAQAKKEHWFHFHFPEFKKKERIPKAQKQIPPNTPKQLQVKQVPPPPFVTKQPVTFLDKLLAFWLYMVRLRFVIDLTRWLINTGGTIAESAFVLSTTYVIINLVGHKLVLWAVFGNTNIVDTFNQIALIAFAVLPELITVSAIKNSYEMWKVSFRTRKIELYLWAIIFTVPTIIFTWMTIYTITQFTSIESVGQVFTLDVTSLRLRVVSGWVYGVSQMLFVEISKGTLDNVVADLKYQIVTTTQVIADRDSTITTLHNSITTLQNDMATLQNEVVALRISNAQKKVASRKHPSTTQPSENNQGGNATHTHTNTHTQESTDTLSASDKRKRLKESMKRALVNGDKLNIKKISAAAGVSYGTGLKHADTIIKEITDEHPAIQLVKDA